MQVQVPQEGSTEDHEQIQVSGDRPLGLIHSGNRYAFGYGPDFYGIWDAASSGPPSERFPTTDQGREEGWKRYLELEPSSAGTVIAPLNPDEVWRREVEARKRRGRRKSLITLGVLAVVIIGGIVGFAVLGGGGAAASKELSAKAKAKKAHVDITGDVTASEDLIQSSFTSTSIESLFGASVVGEWKGTTVDLTIDFHNPAVGTFTTTIISEKSVKMVITQPDGSSLLATSNRGECKVTVDEVQEKGFSGSFDCTAVPLSGGEGGTIDAKGTFGASSKDVAAPSP
jgi:hypothetical protein